MVYILITSVDDCIGTYVEDHGRLPDSIESLDCKDILRDPLNDQEFIVYRRYNDFHAMIYSKGFDGVDNEGMIPFDPTYSKLLPMLPEPNKKTEGPPPQVLDDARLTGDLTLFLFLEQKKESDEMKLVIRSLYDNIYKKVVD